VVHPLTLNLLTTTIVAPPSNASKWQMGFNSAFKGLTSTKSDTAVCELSQIWFTHACLLRPSLFQLSVLRYNGRWLPSHQAGTWLQCSVTFGARIGVYVCMYVYDITQFAPYLRTQYFTLMMQGSVQPVNKTAT
jgi:hypothetical protein